MRIGFFTDSYWPRIDGVVISVDLMRRALEELGHEVYVICPKYPNQPKGDKYVIRVPGFDPLVFSDFTSRVVVGDVRTRAKIEALNLDILHTHSQFMAGLLAVSVAKRQSIPIVSTYHTHLNTLIEFYPYSIHLGSLVGAGVSTLYLRRLDAVKEYLKYLSPTQDSLSNRIDGLMKVFFNNTDRVIANSDHVYQHLSSLEMKVPISIVRNGIDVESFKTNLMRVRNETYEIAYVARVSHEKRQDTIIEAVDELKRGGYRIKLHIAGDGPQLQYCKDLVSELKLSRNVVFHGGIDQAEVRELLSKCHIGVLASSGFDTYPLTLMEYLGAGLPVVYCDPNFETMGSKKSMVYSAVTAHSFAQAIKKIIDENKLSIMHKAALHDAKAHSIDQRAKELEAVYLELLASKAD